MMLRFEGDSKNGYRTGRSSKGVNGSGLLGGGCRFCPHENASEGNDKVCGMGGSRLSRGESIERDGLEEQYESQRASVDPWPKFSS